MLMFAGEKIGRSAHCLTEPPCSEDKGCDKIMKDHIICFRASGIRAASLGCLVDRPFGREHSLHMMGVSRPTVHIFGASGSGVSTLGRALAAERGWDMLDVDDFFWLPTDPPFVQKRPAEERLALLGGAIDASRGAVVAGSLCGWGDPLICRFTLALRLITPRSVRLERLHARESARFGARLLPGGDMAAEHTRFMEWSAEYDTGGPDMRSRAMHDAWSAALPCPCHALDGTLPVSELLALTDKLIPKQ